MFRVTSLTAMPEKQLDRWIKRIGLLLLLGIAAFIAFYAVDRFRAPAVPIVDREMARLEEAVRTDPADVASRGQLADLYLAKQRFEDAIGQYTILVDAKKDVELAKLGRAQAYQQTAQYDAAVADYTAVIEVLSKGEMANVDPNLAKAYYGVGTIAMTNGKPQDAIEPLTRATAIQRADADALLALGTAFIDAGQPDKAIEPLRRASSLVPVGWSEPYLALERAYQATSESGLAEWAAAMALLVTGDDAGAETRLLALADGDQALEAAMGLALIMETRGETLAAADWYAKALAIDPDNVAAQLGLSRVRPVPAASPAEGNN